MASLVWGMKGLTIDFGEIMETPGLILKREREVRGFSLKQIAAITRIPESSLEAIEENNFDEFPAEVFARGFVRNYAKELQVSCDDIMQAYDAMKMQESRMVSENVVAIQAESSVTTYDVSSAMAFNEVDAETQDSASDITRHGFKWAYVLVALIAVASIAISVAFSGTGEADEGSGMLPMQEQGVEQSPFLISNTPDGWD